MDSEVIIDALREELSGMKEDLREMKEFLTNKDERISCLEATVADLSTVNSNMQSKLEELEAKIDATEAYERRDTIIISGDVDRATNGEDSKKVAIDLIQRKLGGFKLLPSDISVAHRLQTSSPPQGQTAKPPNMYIKLCRRDLKPALIQASKQQPKNTSRIYINESLTPTRTAIRKSLLNMKRSHPDVIKGVTSQEGVVVVFTPAPAAAAGRERAKDLRHRISTRSQLKKFCEDFIKKPLDDYIISWPKA